MPRFGFGFGDATRRRRSGGAAVALLPNYPSIATFGDSITVGVNASVAANRWANIVATGVGATLLNAGISGTVLQNSNDSGGSPRTSNGRDRFAADVLGANKKAAVFIAYGFNDARYTGAPGSFNIAQYANDLREVLNGLIIGGYAKADIYVGTPYYITDAGLGSGSAGFTGQTRLGYEAFVQAALDVAGEFGVKSCNLYAWPRDNGFAATIDTDNIHPLNAGHALIAQCWQTQTSVANALGSPATIGTSFAAQTVTITAAAVAGAVSYEYALVANPADVATNTTGVFSGVAGGGYHGKARAVFAGGTKGPWTIGATPVSVVSPGTTTGQTESYAATADNTLLNATAPSQGSWTQNGYSTGNAAIGGNAIRGPATQNQMAVAHLAAALGPGVFGEGVLSVKSNTAALLSAGVVLRSDPAAQNFLIALYNGQNIRLLKSIGGVFTQIGAAYPAVLTVGSSYALRVEARAGAQAVFLDGLAVVTASEPESGLTGVGTGMGVRFQSGPSTPFTNANGPTFTSVKVGTLS